MVSGAQPFSFKSPAGCFPAVMEAWPPLPAEAEGLGVEGAGGLLTLPAFQLSLPAPSLVAAQVNS